MKFVEIEIVERGADGSYQTGYEPLCHGVWIPVEPDAMRRFFADNNLPQPVNIDADLCARIVAGLADVDADDSRAWINAEIDFGDHFAWDGGTATAHRIASVYAVGTDRTDAENLTEYNRQCACAPIQ